MRSLAATLAKGFSVGILNRILMIAMHACAARALGATAYGVFVCVHGLAMILAGFGSLGLNEVITRFVTQYSVEEKWGKLKGVLILADQLALRVTLPLMAACAGAAFLLTDYFSEQPNLKSCLIVGSICIPVLALRQLRHRELLGFHLTKWSMFFEEGAVPLIMVLYLFLFPVERAIEVVIAFTVASVVVTVTMTLILWLRIPKQAMSAVADYDTREWLTAAWPTLLGRSGAMLLRRVDVLVVGPLLGFAAVGIYSAAMRVSLALHCIPVILGTILRPMFAAAHCVNDVSRVRQLFLSAMVGSLILAIPIVLLLSIFSAEVMQWVYGGAFLMGGQILFILALGQAVNAVAGPLPALLTMTGQEKSFGYTTLAVFVGSVIATLIVIPIWGLVGVAVVASLSLIVLRCWQLVIVLPYFQTPTTVELTTTVKAKAEMHS